MTPQSPSKAPRRVRWSCTTCGALFDAWAAAERHADRTGHRRLENIL